MNLDIGKAFTFVTEDQKWVAKLAIGGGLLLAGFITLIGWVFTVPVVLGYLVHLARNVIAGNPQPMPEWDNWGERWIIGFKSWVISLVYALPAVIVSLLFTVPSSILSNSSNNGAAAAGGLIGLVGSCLNFLLSIVVAIILPAAIGRFAATGNLAEGFKFAEVFATVRQNIGMYVIIALFSTIVASILTGIGLIVCLIGAAFTGFYAYLMSYHLYGQAYRSTQGTSIGYGQPPLYGEPRPF